jgi:hypothetical protein
MISRVVALGLIAEVLLAPLSRAEDASTITKIKLGNSEADAPYDAKFWIISERPPTKRIDASKRNLIREDMTVGELVAALGKGWEGRWDNVGIVSWQFDDGTELLVSLSDQSLRSDTILTFHPSVSSARMRWVKG